MGLLGRQVHLAEIVSAGIPTRCRPARLNRRQEERHEYADDRNHDQKLDESECALRPAATEPPISDFGFRISDYEIQSAIRNPQSAIDHRTDTSLELFRR